MQTFNGLRHGEVLLIPTNDKADGKELPKGSYVLAESDAGHDHVLEGQDFKVTQSESGRTFVTVIADTALVHRKEHDNHRTLVVPVGTMERYEMVEYNPASKVIQKVTD